MKTNKSNSKERKTCNHCSYDANPIGAKNCQKCGKPLKSFLSRKNNQAAKPKFEFPYFWLILGLLFLLFGVGSYFFWQQVLPSSSVSDRNTNSNNSTSNTSSNSDIQSYNSMKEVPNVPTGTFNFGGSLIFASLVAQGTHKSISQAHPQFTLRYVDPPDSQPGTGKGIEMLLDGQLSFALSGRPLEDAEYQKAIDRGFRLDQVAVAIDGLGSYTHPDISIPGLSVSQLQNIYTGKITNWKEVGGPNLPIVPLSINTKTTALLKTLLGSKIKNVSPKVRSSRDYTVLVRDVASTPGAIGIGAAMLVATQKTVRPVALAPGDTKQYISVVTDDGKLNMAAFKDGTYPITRYLYIIVRRDGRAEEQAGVAYANLLLSKEGQQFVEKAGLVPIR